jgi:hypothetical protein
MAVFSSRRTAKPPFPIRNYYIPMSDLLAGLVFILIIVLQAVALVARDDFAKSDEVVRETRVIEARLAALREIERTQIRPREQTEAALRDVLEAMAADITARGLAAAVNPDGRQIVLTIKPLVSGGSVSAEARLIAGTLGQVFSRWQPCLAPGRPTTCPGLGAPKLSQVVWMTSSAGDAAIGGAAAAALYAEMSVQHPALTQQRNRDGAPLHDFRGRASPQAEIVLNFGIVRVPLPQDIIEIGPR